MGLWVRWNEAGAGERKRSEPYEQGVLCLGCEFLRQRQRRERIIIMNKLSTQNGLVVAVRRLVLPWFISSVQVPRWLFVLMWVALLACFWGFNKK